MCVGDRATKYPVKALLVENNGGITGFVQTLQGFQEVLAFSLIVTFIETFSDWIWESRIRWRRQFQSPTLRIGPAPLVVTGKKKKSKLVAGDDHQISGKQII